MINYEIYKIIHLYSLVILFVGIALQTFTTTPKKSYKIWTGVASLLIFISGMGLLARIGVKHAEPWANWIRVKLAVWMILTIVTPIIFKRFSSYAKIWWIVSLVLLLVAMIAVQYQFA